MLASFYHKAQLPWVYQVNNGTIEVQFRIAKHSLKNATLLAHDLTLQTGDFYLLSDKMAMNKLGVTEFHEYWVGRVKIFTKRYCYSFKLETFDDKIFYFGQTGVINEKEWWAQSKAFTYDYWDRDNFLTSPVWYQATNWYQICPRKFNQVGKKTAGKPINAPNKPVDDGNLNGIIAKLDYIQALGFNGICLTSIFAINLPHQTKIGDDFRLDSVLGNETILQNLISQCHQRGLKIMLEGVFNYLGWWSGPWQDVLNNKHHSRYQDWFFINDLDHLHEKNLTTSSTQFAQTYPYETYEFNPAWPRLNLANLSVKKYLFKAIATWTKLGIDGWKIGAYHQSNVNFWGEFKQVVTNINPDIAIVGQTSDDSTSLLQNSLWHGTINYRLGDIIIKFVLSSQALDDKLIFIEQFNAISFDYSPEQQWKLMNLFTTQDKSRLITMLGHDEVKYALAMSLMFYSPGVTLTFYGEEIGLESPHGLAPCPKMLWGKNKTNYKPLLKKLISNKKQLIEHISIFDRTYARLDDENNIIIDNPRYFVIIKNQEVKLELL